MIDFVMQLFDITFPQAIIRMSSDFGLDITPARRTRAEASEIIERRKAEQDKMEALREQYTSVEDEHLYWVEASRVFSPDTYSEPFFHPLYCEAVKRLPQLEHWLEENIESGLRKG